MIDKQMRIIELLTELQELIPGLGKLVINDPIEPDFILLCTDEYLEVFLEETGSSVISEPNNDDNGPLQ